jgi:flagellar assembly factor FliW
LGGTIASIKDLESLFKAIANLKSNLKPGGLLIIEPWHFRENFQEGIPEAVFVDNSDIKLTRMNVTSVNKEKTQSVQHYHYMAATPTGITHFEETTDMGLYSFEEYSQAIQAAGFTDFRFDRQGGCTVQFHK